MAELCWATLSRQCTPLRNGLKPSTKEVLLNLVWNGKHLQRHSAYDYKAPTPKLQKDPLLNEAAFTTDDADILSDPDSSKSSEEATSSCAESDRHEPDNVDILSMSDVTELSEEEMTDMSELSLGFDEDEVVSD